MISLVVPAAMRGLCGQQGKVLVVIAINACAKPAHCLLLVGGVVPAKRAAFQCGNDECGAAVWQRPEDLVLVGAWPRLLWTPTTSSESLHLPSLSRCSVQTSRRGIPYCAHPSNGVVAMTCRTVVAQDLLQLYESLKLTSPTIALTAFVKGLADAHERTGLQQVSGYTRFDLP